MNDNNDAYNVISKNNNIFLVRNDSSYLRRAILDLSSLNSFENNDEFFDLCNISKAIIKEEQYITNETTQTFLSVSLTYRIFNGAYHFDRNVIYSSAVTNSQVSYCSQDEKPLSNLPLSFVELLKSYL